MAEGLHDRIRVKEEIVLADDWSTLKKALLDFKGSDGQWRSLTRETYDRGNGATILLYNKAKRSVILTKQFRYPAYVNGYSDLMIEVCAGLLDENDAETCIKLEAEEETGYRVTEVKKIWEVYMSPGSVTEKLFFFIGEYDDPLKVSRGGGVPLSISARRFLRPRILSVGQAFERRSDSIRVRPGRRATPLASIHRRTDYAMAVRQRASTAARLVMARSMSIGNLQPDASSSPNTTFACRR